MITRSATRFCTIITAVTAVTALVAVAANAAQSRDIAPTALGVNTLDMFKPVASRSVAVTTEISCRTLGGAPDWLCAGENGTDGLSTLSYRVVLAD